ncbi:MAG: nitrous oxide reductase accessory protein NosL [Chitinophagaceae bacterium]|nr:nitrous oxide reductase accessory protein NosL [Chitinophagaceae bacterium]
MSNKISPFSKTLIIAAAVALIISLFVPIWSIYLDAPQYPEGLRLQIWANAIAGDVDIINGLNHYIGMKTLHTKDFLEFTILPYLISGFALLFLIAAFVGRKKGLYIVFGAFVLFGIIAMVDFWKWEYDYGHNLDPNAAIKVPGMAYQPPLIGFKQLLNFGAYSIPSTGGWLFISAGVLLLFAILKEGKFFRKKQKVITAGLAASLFFVSCNSDHPEPINLYKDACESCKMSISDERFASELITKKGRIYKFDDLGCMLGYVATLGEANIKKYYVADYTNSNVLLDAATAWYVHNEALHSPMNGNTAAFPSKEAAVIAGEPYQAKPLGWNDLGNLLHNKETGDVHPQ